MQQSCYCNLIKNLTKTERVEKIEYYIFDFCFCCSSCLFYFPFKYFFYLIGLSFKQKNKKRRILPISYLPSISFRTKGDFRYFLKEHFDFFQLIRNVEFFKNLFKLKNEPLHFKKLYELEVKVSNYSFYQKNYGVFNSILNFFKSEFLISQKGSSFEHVYLYPERFNLNLFNNLSNTQKQILFEKNLNDVIRLIDINTKKDPSTNLEIEEAALEIFSEIKHMVSIAKNESPLILKLNNLKERTLSVNTENTNSNLIHLKNSIIVSLDSILFKVSNGNVFKENLKKEFFEIENKIKDLSKAAVDFKKNQALLEVKKIKSKY